MYVECKGYGGSDRGPARIGRVFFNRTRKTLTYRNKRFQRGEVVPGANYFDVETREGYWISGPKRRGGDRHHCGGGPVEIDDDVREEYWREIRHEPDRVADRLTEGGRTATTESLDALHVWVKAHVKGCDVEAAERLDLDDFLGRTAHIRLAPAERLRLLAIELEGELYEPQPRGFLALDRVYRLAISLAPNYPEIHSSRALSADRMFCPIVVADGDLETVRPLIRTAREAIQRALELAPESAHVLGIAGLVTADDPDQGAAEALLWFDRALAVDPNDQWSKLHRAYCLQVLERWDEAIAAYQSVDPAFLCGLRAWRHEDDLECIVYCHYRAGRLDEATDLCRTLLERWTKDPSLVEINLNAGDYLTMVLDDDRLDESLRRDIRAFLTRRFGNDEAV